MQFQSHRRQSECVYVFSDYLNNDVLFRTGVMHLHQAASSITQGYIIMRRILGAVCLMQEQTSTFLKADWPVI